MLRFDWLKHIKSTRIRRPRSSHRMVRHTAEILQVRTLLSSNPLASMSMAEGDSAQTQHAHPAAMDLVSADQATNTVVASGNWSDPTVWQDGSLPADGARIVIPEGMTLTVDSVIPQEFKTIGIHGTLRFASDTHTELRVDTIISAPHGRFEMGTAANPIAADVTATVVFVDDGAIDTNWDPEQLSRGAVLQGPTEIHGAETTHQVTLAAHPAAGATTLHLASVPVGWSAGDEIVITGTQGSTSDEVRTIAAIDSTTVTLNQALQLDHIPPRADLNVYVANTTRNVELTSENPATAHRGHVMFMHTNNASVHNAAFTQLGRTDKKIPLDDFNFEFPEDAVGNRTSAGVVFTATPGARTNVRGRYPVHFHRGGTDPNSTPGVVDGSVVVGSPGYGLVNHSSNVDLTNNISYDIHGSAFYTEAGDEIGSIVNNIAIRTVNPDFRLEDNGEVSVDLRADQQDFGVDGDAFWLSGHLVSMKDNIASGASGHGIIIWSDGLVETDRGRSTVRTADIENGHLITGRDTIPTWWAPLAEISNNEASNATIGFRTRYLHSSVYLGDVGSPFHEPPDQAYIDTLSPTIDGLTVWGSRDGALLNYSERLSLKNADIIGTGAPYVRQDGTTDLGVGIDMYNENSRGPGVVENVRVEGFNMGILAPRHGEWQMSNIHLRNTTDLHIEQSTIESRALDMTNVTFGDLAGTAVAGNEGQRRHVVMKGDEAGIQPFWFLMTDTVSLNGQGLYFDQQAASHVPLTAELREDSRAPVPTEFVGLTNQQLQDTYGTSFGGEITPSDTQAVSWLTGGVVGSLAEPGQTDPPLYEMRDADTFDVVSLGTLTNFDPSQLTTGTPDDEGEDEDEPEDADETNEEGDEVGDDDDVGEGGDESDEDSGSDDEDEGSGDEPGEADEDSDEEPAGEEGEEDPEDEESDEGDEEPGDDEESDEGAEEPGDSEESDESELSQLLVDLRALSDQELINRVNAFEPDAEGAAELLEELRAIRELDDEALGEEIAELEEIERQELAEWLRGLGLGAGHEDAEPEDDEGSDEGDGEPGNDGQADEDHDGDGHGDTGGGDDHEGGDHDQANHACDAHAGNPTLMQEHCAAMALATPEAATHSVVASGDWSDPNVWQNGTVPTDGAAAYIPAGMTVTVDGVIGETIQTLRIDGTLQFNPGVDTELRVDTVIAAPGSRFEMGTTTAPIADDVTARLVVADTGAVDRMNDPFFLGRGLILHGSTEIHGAAKTSFTTTAIAPRAGDTTITLSEVPTNWGVGDTLVIAGTRIDAEGDEVVTIANIDGATITLEDALEFDHVPPRSEFAVHVANTTRNAVIESENGALDRRGHLMFMHSRDVQIAYGGFYELGRTDKLQELNNAELDASGRLIEGTGTNPGGRYSVHFHRNGVRADSPPATVTGSAVVGSPGWGYVNHSSYVDFTDNVSYNVNGAAFNTEAGDEIGAFIGNLSIRTHGTGESPVERQGLQDFGHAGDGFWFQGAGVRIENNVASGATGAGLIVYSDALIQEGLGRTEFRTENLADPSLASGLETIPVTLVPLRSFKGNTAYGSLVGARTYYHRTLIQVDEDQFDQAARLRGAFPDSVMEDTLIWNSREGYLVNYTVDTVFRNFTIVNAADQPGVTGYDATNVYNRGRHTYENFDVEGFATGLVPSRNGVVEIRGGRFNNGQDIQIQEPRQSHRLLTTGGMINFVDSPGLQFEDEFIPRQNIVMFADPRSIPDSTQEWYLLNSRVILNHNDHDGEQLFYAEQAANHVLYTGQPVQAEPGDPGPGANEDHIGLTNAQLQEMFNGSFGGELPSADAVDVPDDGIVGLLGTATPDPGPFPEHDDPLAISPEDIAELVDGILDLKEIPQAEVDQLLAALDPNDVNVEGIRGTIERLRALNDSEVQSYVESLSIGELTTTVSAIDTLFESAEASDADDDPGTDEEDTDEPGSDEEDGDDEASADGGEVPDDEGEENEEDTGDESEDHTDDEEEDSPGDDPGGEDEAGTDDAGDSETEEEQDASTDVLIDLPSGSSDISIENNELVVVQGGDEFSRTPLDGALNLTINGTIDADVLILDLRAGADLNLETITINAGDGDDSVTFLGKAPGGSTSVQLNGEGGHDVIIGSRGGESLHGGAGNDTLVSGAGSDELQGGTGDDILIGNGGHDTLDGGEGDDFVRGDSGHDDMTAGSGADVLLGKAGNDTLRFTAGIDSADGGTGSNTMMDDSTSTDATPEIGGTHVEVLIPEGSGPLSLTLQNGSLVVSEGGTVQRRITLSATETITITGSIGNDELDIDFSNPRAVQVSTLTIDGGDGDDHIRLLGLAAMLADSVIANGGDGNDVISLDRNIRESVTVNGGNGHDSITTARGRDVINGGPGNDFLDGGAQRDVIKGDAGHDRIFGRGGSDKIYGGSGFDTVNGNGGNDLILGNSGDDFLKGASGNDHIIGHGGNDVLRGDIGDDILQAGAGDDVLLGNAGNDGLSAGAGNDLALGHAGDDSIVAGEGDDTATGHRGNDIVLGGHGNDSIAGNAGTDTLAGGQGDDEVVGPEIEIDEDFILIGEWIDRS